MRVEEAMKIFSFVLAVMGLLAHAQPTFAQGSGPAGSDGKIVEQAAFELPAYEQIPDRFRRVYPKEAVERMRSGGLELLKIKYLSDGLKVSGFIYKPKETAGKKLPVVIWNRGGVGEDTIIGI